MFELRADPSLGALRSRLSDFARTQLPFAMSVALTKTAQDAKAAELEEMDRIFDRPTPFTRRSIYLRSASKSRLVSLIGLKDRQADYLRLQIRGGRRRPAKRALLIPTEHRKNRYGNLPRGSVKKMRASGRVFSGRPAGWSNAPAGLWQRMGRGGRDRLRLLVTYEDHADYRPIFDFAGVARHTGGRVFEGHLLRALEKAMRTSKRRR